MPSHRHEVLVEMFKDQPRLAAEVLSGPLHTELPEFDDATVSSGELTDVIPTEYRADAVVMLTYKGVTAAAVVVEVQLRVDARKRFTWPAYVATLYARVRRPVVLLVLSLEDTVSAWAAEPIRAGDLVLTPRVMGPGEVPRVTDLEQARRCPELTVLSAMAHATRENPLPVYAALLTALDALDHDHANLYTDIVLAVLPKAARDSLEAYMTATPHRYESDFARRYFAAGEVRALLKVLAARGIEVSDPAREVIESCKDLERLDVWVDRAATARTVDDLFTGDND